MSFANFSGSVFLAGLLGLAALLFLLQRLRVKYRDVQVVTILFWKQAVEENRARVLIRRFRHPLAYFLALAIAALIWIAMAEPEWNQEGEGEFILLLDASAGMAWGDRLASAAAFMREEAALLPADRRMVYLCGADAALVLDRGEEAFLLAPRLKGLVAEACPASITRQIRALAAGAGGVRLNILVFGDAPVPESVLEVLPATVLVKRVRRDATPSLRENEGILGIGVAAAASGAFDRVDVMVGHSGTADVSATLGGLVFEQTMTAEDGVIYWRDLPARGEVLEVAVREGDVLSLDDSARIVLPSRAPIYVAGAEDADSRLRDVVEVHPALGLATESTPARVAIAEAPDAALPTLVVGPGNELVVTHEPQLSPLELDELRARVASVGLERVGRRLESAGGEPFQVAVRLQSGPRRMIEMGAALLDRDYDFAQSSAFPAWMSEALMWLAGEPPIQSFAAAGERLAVPDDLTIAGASYAPPRAGHYRTNDGGDLEVAAGPIATGADDALPVTAGFGGSVRLPGVAGWCLIIALVLVLGEWWLFQKGRIP